MNNPNLLVEISEDVEPISVSPDVIAEDIQKLASIAQLAGQELDEITLSARFGTDGRLILTSQGITLKFRRPGQIIASLPTAVPIEVSSDVYANLRATLAKSNWKEANQETWNLMCQALGKPRGTVLSPQEVGKIPCETIKTIDRLWLEHSQGRFGFTVQQQLYRR